MPTVRFRGREIRCDRGTVLRDVLLAAAESPHNGGACSLNCRGFGSCGTCAVAVVGPVTDRTAREAARLSFPPHDPESELRLACQTRVLDDVRVVKYPGFWGQHVPDPVGGDSVAPGEGASESCETEVGGDEGASESDETQGDET